MTKPSQPTTPAYTRSVTERQPLPNRLVRLLSEARWLALAAIGLYFVLIMLSFTKVDPGWSRVDSVWPHPTIVPKVANLGGRAGAWLSDLLLFIFGFSAWWWCICWLRIVWNGYLRLARSFVLEKDTNAKHDGRGSGREIIIRTIGFVFLFIGSAGLEYLRMRTLHVQLPRAPGGVLGQLVGHAAYVAFGFTGAPLLLLLLFGCGLTLFFQVSWLALAERIGANIEFVIDCLMLRNQNYESRHHSEVAASQPSMSAVKPEIATVIDAQAAPAQNFPMNHLLPLSLLDQARPMQETASIESLEFTSRLIEKKLSDFGVRAKVVAAYPGPVVTRYEIEPASGVKASQIIDLARDLARALSLTSIRVVETIPEKNYMALELPNQKRQIVRLSDILGSSAYEDDAPSLPIVLGKDIVGKSVVVDLAKMPHLLLAGTTDSGKSVAINTTILSLLYKCDPLDVRLLLIDPKMLEMSVYQGIPHLLAPVVTDMRQAGYALNWAVNEVERRYKLMSKLGVRNLAAYNARIAGAQEPIPNPFSLTPDAPEPLVKLPTIVIIIDELADLMIVVGKKIEELIARIAQKARGAGLHLILATQCPSADVVTGLIKANIPTRIAFQVSSKTDSRTILDQAGAEALLGMGDMLYMPLGTSLPVRIHGAFVSKEEVERVVNYLKTKGEPNYIKGILDGGAVGKSGAAAGQGGAEADTLYDQAVAIVLTNRRASISLVQRHLRIGYNRAMRLLDQMEKNGVVSTIQSNGNREILAPAETVEEG